MAKTAGSRASWGVLAGAGALVALQPVGCIPQQDDPPEDWFDSPVVAEFLAQVGPGVVIPALEDFSTELRSLADALDALTAAQQGGGATEPAWTDAQVAWEGAMLSWQVLEPMQIGPAASSLDARGGQDLRDEIYSWPTINPCRVDQETVEAQWASAGFFSGNLVNSYGLDAVEYLLHAGPENDCPGQVDINQDGSWDALGTDGVDQARAEFAQALVAELEAQNAGLITAWSPTGGDFSGAMHLDPQGEPFESEKSAANAVFDALFYLEIVTKDRKLGEPLGLNDCSSTVCPESVEHLPSGLAVRAIEANLAGFRALFTGGDGAGMDDLLADLGHGDLADAILAGTDAALAVVGGIQGDLASLLETDPAAVQSLYDAVKTVSDLLKNDLVTVLSLTVPDEAAGDAD